MYIIPIYSYPWNGGERPLNYSMTHRKPKYRHYYTHAHTALVSISVAYRNEQYVLNGKFYICLKLPRGHVRQICLRPTMEANLYS